MHDLELDSNTIQNMRGKKYTAMDPQAPQESAKRKESANKKMIAPFLP